MDIEAEMRRLSNDQARDVAIINREDMFEVDVDVHAYNPQDLTVSVVDNVLHIKGKHEETYPGGTKYVSSEFERTYPLSSDALIGESTSSYSLDGKTLKVVVPIKKNPNARKSPKISSFKSASASSHTWLPKQTISSLSSSSATFEQQQQQSHYSMQQQEQTSTSSKMVEDSTGIQVNRETSPSSNKKRC
jgi:HSP20 family molecular chaperone IbpA